MKAGWWEENSFLPATLQFWPRKQQLMERKEEKEASAFRGWAGKGKIMTEFFLWRTWSWWFPIVPSLEEHRAPLTESSSLLQSPPLCAEWTAHSASLHPPFVSVLITHAVSPPELQGKVHSFLLVPPHPACWHLSHTSSHLLLSKAPCALDRHILNYFSWSTFCQLFLFI